MPSVTFMDAASTNTLSIHSRPEKDQKPSITQTYFLAYTARTKLSRQAAQPDPDLRLLIGHANMLDSLIFDLENAEQEQERWLNNILNGSSLEGKEVKYEEMILVLKKDEKEIENKAKITTSQVDHSIQDNEENYTLTRTV
ncbi:hypothetical protein PV08_02242 [Exophiala spinifera]|uniref:Uncharacterized protein n=1 Tax=Exophiala spinifera TaxID=91928 RepID=A0A0D2AA72_9EURO|nr:uncharacterized protein PV08_02242 [Exophiala spinifera]KIW21662.1 hypothetical protein PV08_02242 [Exophiala spinifera]